MIDVQAPDGTIIRFPEGTADDVILDVMRREYGGRQPETAARGAVGRAIDWLSGVNRREDIPQAAQARLGLSASQAAQMAALLSTTASDDRLMRGISKIEPSAQFDKDEFGNLIAVMPIRDEEGRETGRTRFYPNPKGLDLADITQAAGALSLGGALGKGAQVLGAPISGLLGGATLGATEAGLAELASSQLTDSPFQVSDIPYGAAGGAAASKVADVLQGLLRPGSAAFDPSGALTPAAAAAVTAAGLDPASITREAAEAILQRTRAAVDPVEAGRLAEAQTLPVPVPLTRGEVTGSPGQQLFEDMALKGAYGEGPAAMLRGRRAEQQQAIQQNIGAIQEYLAGTSPIVGTMGEGGAAAQSALAARRAAETQTASDLYTAARASGPAILTPAADQQVSQAVRAVLPDYNPRTAPDAYAFADELDQMLGAGRTVSDLFAWREQVSNASRANTPDASAMGKMLNQFDAAMSDAVTQSLLAGDSAAVSRWSDAIKNYKSFAQTWKSKGGVLNALTEQVTRDGARTLKVAPEAATNYIFGVGGSKLISQPALARDLMTLKSTLPEAEWGMLRQEALMNLLARGSGGVRDGERMFSGVKFLKAIDDFTTKNPSTAKVLFTPEERKLISQFASVSARATGGAINASNTAAAGAGLLQQLVTAIGGTNASQLATRIVGFGLLRSLYGGTRGYRAITSMTSPAPVSAPVAGAGGAAVSGPTMQEPTSRQIQRTTGVPFGVQ
jgi:hypothetical protein